MFGKSNGKPLFAGVRELLSWHRLAGQRGLIDKDVLGLQQAEVGRDHVARRKPHDITRDNGFDGDFREVVMAICGLTPDGRRGPYHASQPGSSLIRAVLLHKGGRDRQHHHDRDDDRGPQVTQKIGHARQREQKRIERILGTAPNLLEDGWLSFTRDQIGAI